MSIKTTIKKISRSQNAYEYAKMLAIAGGVKSTWFDKVEARHKDDNRNFMFFAAMGILTLTVGAILLDNYLEVNGFAGLISRFQMGIPVQVWGLITMLLIVTLFSVATIRGVAGTPFEYLAETEIALLNDSIIAGAEAHGVAPIVLTNEKLLGMRLLKQISTK